MKPAKGVSAKALRHQCFNKSTSKVSYVDDRELATEVRLCLWPQCDSVIEGMPACT